MQTKSPAATSAQVANKASMLAVDTAYALSQFAEWSRALFIALETLSKSDVHSAYVTNSLIGIGNFLAEEAINQAEGFGSDAEKLREVYEESKVPRE